jgi:single-strand DNA-binding protein
MSKDLNKVMIIGRLGVAPEMRFTPGGSAVTTFRMASGRSWKEASGEQREETEWVNVVCWNKLAEIANQYLVKGSRVYVEGRLQTRTWDDAQTGQKHYKTEVIANDMIMLDAKAGGAGAPPAPDISDEDLPF